MAAGGRPRDRAATQAILAAALRQLNSVGYVNMSMDSVAVEAGVARTTVYRRFRDKADLVTAAIASDLVLKDGAESADPRGDLIDFVEEFDRHAGRCMLEVLGSLLGSHEEAGILELHRERVIGPRSAYARSLLLRAVELGQLRPDVDLDLTLKMLVGAVLARTVSGSPPRPGWVAEAVDALWRAWAPVA